MKKDNKAKEVNYKLSREERIDAYTYAILSIYSDGIDLGICGKLKQYCEREYANELDKNNFYTTPGIYPWVFLSRLKQYFPEFSSLQPRDKGSFGFWWPMNNKGARIEALIKAIELAKKAKK